MGFGSVIVLLISTAVTIPISALLLMLSTKFFKLSDQSYMTALKVALIVGVVSFVLSLIGTFSLALVVITSALSFIVSILLGIWLIKTNYSLDWQKTLLVWVVWFILGLILGFIIALVLGAIFLAVGLSAATQAGLLG
tara:strand:- start:44 stop:457 length:414 start_codon:yes stop_codon:yes gene_type:complete